MIAGGSGMAPILSLLRAARRASGCARPVRFFYGARTDGDLFCARGDRALGARWPISSSRRSSSGSCTRPSTSTSAARELATPDVYMCGPPPMVEAAEAMLIDKHGIDEQRIFVDKFTTSADAAPSSGGVGEPLGAAAPAAPDDAPSATSPGTRRRDAAPRLYEDVTIDTQPSVHRHLSRGWPVSFEDGRGTWNDASTALRCRDWFAFRDPGEQWERPFYQAGTAIEQQIEGAMRSAAERGPAGGLQPGMGRVPARLPAGAGLRRARPVVRAGDDRAATACRTRWPPACACRRR